MVCSKCNLREPNEGRRYCRVCETVYAREYRPKAAKAKAQANFSRGVVAMREALVSAFQEVGDKELNGYTAAKIAQAQMPD